MPNSITTIKSYSFSICSDLKAVVLSKSLDEIPKRCFWKSGLERIEIPSNVHRIDDNAFDECTNLKAVILSEDL